MVVAIKKYDVVNCYRAVVLMREIIELNNEPIISNYREYALLDGNFNSTRWRA